MKRCGSPFQPAANAIWRGSSLPICLQAGSSQQMPKAESGKAHPRHPTAYKVSSTWIANRVTLILKSAFIRPLPACR